MNTSILPERSRSSCGNRWSVSICEFIITWDQPLWANFQGLLRTAFFCRKTCDLLRGAFTHTRWLLGMLPLVFRELCWPVVSLPVFFSWPSRRVNRGYSKLLKKLSKSRVLTNTQESSRKTNGGILRSLPVFLTAPPSKSRVLKTAQESWVNRGYSQMLKKALGKLTGGSWGVYRCFWPSRRVNREFSERKQFLEPFGFFP